MRFNHRGEWSIQIMRDTKTVYWKIWLKIELFGDLCRIHWLSFRKFCTRNVFYIFNYETYKICKLQLNMRQGQFFSVLNQKGQNSWFAKFDSLELTVAYFFHLGLPILAEQGQGSSYWIYSFLKARCWPKWVSNTAVTNRWAKSCFYSAYRHVEKISGPHQPWWTPSRKSSPLKKA